MPILIRKRKTAPTHRNAIEGGSCFTLTLMPSSDEFALMGFSRVDVAVQAVLVNDHTCKLVSTAKGSSAVITVGGDNVADFFTGLTYHGTN